ncbi:MAG: TIR domain-containing protein [Terricaulis sp.]
MGQYRYRAFISYTRSDRAVAAKLQRELERFELPTEIRRAHGDGLTSKRPFRPIFRDEDELLPGEDLPKRIAAALDASAHLIVILGPTTNRSRWVELEILHFIRSGRRHEILLVKRNGSNLTADDIPLPRSLLFNPSSSGELTQEPLPEPLWVDWAEHSSNRRSLLRVAGTLLGLKSLDELERRDAQAQRRRLALAGVTLTAILVFAGIGTIALAFWQRETLRSQVGQLTQLASEANEQARFDRGMRYAFAAQELARRSLLEFDVGEAQAELIRGQNSNTAVTEIRLPDRIRYVRLSPDSARVMVVLDDNIGGAEVFDARTGRQVGARIEGEFTAPPVFSRDGRFVGSSRDGIIRWYNPATGEEVQVVTPPDRMEGTAGMTSPVLATSANGTFTVAALGNDRYSVISMVGMTASFASIHIENLATATPSSDGRFVLSSSGSSAQLWDARTGNPVGAGMAHDDLLSSVDFANDGTLIATGSRDGVVRLWRRPREPQAPILLPHTDQVWTARYSPDGHAIVTASWDQTARVWDALSGALLIQPLQHPAQVGSAAFSPDGLTIVTACWDGSIRLWNATTGELERVVSMEDYGEIQWVDFSPDGARIGVAAGAYGLVLDARTGEVVLELEKEDSMLHMAFSPDMRSVAVSGWNHDRGAVDVSSLGDGDVWEMRIRHVGVAYMAVYSPNGRQLVTISDDGEASVTDTRTGDALFPAIRHSSAIASAAFAPSGDVFATASIDGTARLWSITDGHPIGIPMRHGGGVRDVAFSSNQNYVATASYDDTARVWDAHTGHPFGTPLQHSGDVVSVEFSPSGRDIVTASTNGSAIIWRDVAGAVALSPDALCSEILMGDLAAFSSVEINRAPFLRAAFPDNVCVAETALERLWRNLTSLLEKPQRRRVRDYRDGPDGEARSRS